ncbi:MAG: SpoIVB peptidase S55 domain-containing protein, partial [Planctomycetota bacterium]
MIPATAAIATLSFDEVRPGMRGTGRTVFEGSRIETFEVEILGKLPNVGPDQNLILARLSGGPLAETGVLAGMSGSPVTIDGKLIGAVAYTWGFAKQAIAGVTPIEEMLAVADLDHAVPRQAGSVAPTLDELRAMRTPVRLRAFLDDLAGRLLPQRTLPISVPIAVSGVDLGGLSRATPRLLRAGFMPIPVGSGEDSLEEVEPLHPGSAMGLKLIRGDVDMTATGTVTWVDGDRVLAFGHPLFGLGAVDLPLTAARVEALLPSTMQSARITRPLGEVGAVHQDRAAGVVGRVGARPRMIPVRLQLTDADGGEHEFSFDIADDSLLSPLLLYVSLNGVLASKERAFGNATIRLRDGSVIKLVDNEDVELDNLYAGPTAFEFGTGIAAYILYLLMNNTWTQPQIVGVNLMLEYEEAPRMARIRRAALDRYRAAPGETVEVTIVLSPYRGADRLLTREIVVPPETPPGPLTVSIGGAL